MAHVNVTVHNAVGTDFVACTLDIVLHEYQHLFIISSNNMLTSDINMFY